MSFPGFSQTQYKYEFADLNALGTLPTQPGNYIFASRVGGKPNIVLTGETLDLRAAIAKHPRWNEAKNKHQAVFILYHVNDQPGRRRIELHDLVRRHTPPMNRAANVEYEED